MNWLLSSMLWVNMPLIIQMVVGYQTFYMSFRL